MALTGAVTDTMPAERPQHKRNKSASMFKSILPSKGSKQRKDDDNDTPSQSHDTSKYSQDLMLPADRPHAGQRALGEIRNLSNGPSSPRKSQAEGRPALYHSSKSVESTDPPSKNKSKDGRQSKDNKSPSKLRTNKSATNLANLFGKNRSQKDLSLSPKKPSKDKENTTPPTSAHGQPTSAPPIWAQFATQKTAEPYEEQSTTTTVPLNDEKEKLREIIRYNPMAYTESRQKDFSEVGQPTLGGKRTLRPKSIEIAAASAKNLFQPITRKASHGKGSREKISDEARGRERKEQRSVNNTPSKFTRESQSASPTKSSRVLAAVATINDKAKDAKLEALVNSHDLDAQFEAVLDSRNIPEPMREKMRTLTPRLKADFIRSNSLEGKESPPSTAGSSSTRDFKESKKADVGKASRTQRSTRSKHESPVADEEEVEDEPVTPKRSRPRSRAFTFNKGDSSPSKKMKGDLEGTSHKREKSTDMHKSASSTSLAAAGKQDGSMRSQKGAKTVMPSEHVQYLHNTANTQDVEVGRLHKLRILLRNETVGWVDAFVAEGGMTEIIVLLHRIMDLEWR